MCILPANSAEKEPEGGGGGWEEIIRSRTSCRFDSQVDFFPGLRSFKNLLARLISTLSI